ncbi:MAG: EF-hand domain-containing protein [Burkholderiales bacterium]|nr:EF-hand domain-containing protein [Burkholderiales bacterium]
MKKVNVAFVTVLLSASIGASVVFAQTPPEAPKGDRAHKMHERLKAADKDGDGKINRTEAAALPRIAKHFDEIDTNKDGFVTTAELKAHRDKRAAHKQK